MSTYIHTMSILIDCPTGKILNPLTNTYVCINSDTGKKILEDLTTYMRKNMEDATMATVKNQVFNLFRDYTDGEMFSLISTSLDEDERFMTKVPFGPDMYSIKDLIRNTIGAIHVYDGEFPVTQRFDRVEIPMSDFEKITVENHLDHPITILDNNMKNVWAYYIDQDPKAYDDFISIVYKSSDIWINVQIDVSPIVKQVRVVFSEDEPDMETACYVECCTDPDEPCYYQDEELCQIEILRMDSIVL